MEIRADLAEKHTRTGNTKCFKHRDSRGNQRVLRQPRPRKSRYALSGGGGPDVWGVSGKPPGRVSGGLSGGAPGRRGCLPTRPDKADPPITIVPDPRTPPGQSQPSRTNQTLPERRDDEPVTKCDRMFNMAASSLYEMKPPNECFHVERGLCGRIRVMCD